jgi:hypothetical protein
MQTPPSPGDVPNLMAAEDMEQISGAMKPLMVAAGVHAADKNTVYAFFVERCVMGASRRDPSAHTSAGAHHQHRGVPVRVFCYG